MQTTTEQRPNWLNRPLSNLISLNWETAIFILILILAVFTRFYNLEARVMSHDETSHTYFSWLLFKQGNYAHDPVTHGPLQFHLVALSYFLFGDSDTTARIPAVLFSITTVAFMWNYRRYLGRIGWLVTALLFVISPFMLYYARYVRNESFVALFGVMTIWATLRYFETGHTRYIFWLTAAIVLHYTSKETSYIYTAQLLLFLGIYFVYRVTQRPWPNTGARNRFLWSLILAIGLAGLGVVLSLANKRLQTPTGVEATVPAVPGQNLAASYPGIPSFIHIGLLLLGGVALITAIYFLISGNLKPAQSESRQMLRFMIGFIAIPVLIGLIIVYGRYLAQNKPLMDLLAQGPAVQPVAGTQPPSNAQVSIYSIAILIPVILAGFGLLFAGRMAMQLPKEIWSVGNGERSFDLLIVIGSLILPTLSAFLIKLFSNPLDYSMPGMIKTATVLIPMFMLSIGIGLGWNPRLWLGNAALFYGIFVVFYTTVFTNGAGFFTGTVGSLGYWIAQQAVNRGTQPWYYYILVEIPVYEYLPALGSLMALGFMLFRRKSHSGDLVAEVKNDEGQDSSVPEEIQQPQLAIEQAPVLPLIGFWAVTSIVAYSYAGEKMPWITVHIALPLILLAGWAIGLMIESTDWAALRRKRGLLVVVLIIVFIMSLAGTLGSLLGTKPPFQGKDLAQLQATVTFITALLTAIATGWWLWYLLKNWTFAQISRTAVLVVFTILGVLTARTAFMASYINYDLAKEYLVYAHCGPGIKEVLNQITDISRRTTDGLALQVAYDDQSTYPYWWYLRNFTNQRYYGNNPSRDLRDVPVILVGDTNYSKIEPIVGQAFYQFEYIRIWWPDESYKNLTWKRISYALTNREMREALWQIWLNRDYSKYATLAGRDLSLPNWQPSQKFRMYVRKDIAAKLWNYGIAPSAETVLADPYEGKGIKLAADRVIGTLGSEPGQFTTPRNIAVAPDGSLYVADTGNHRIQHLSVDGTVLKVWGSFADISKGAAPGGTFYEPWGIAVGPDGSVYVADTWNNRIQKFTKDGEFVTMWGYGISQTEDPLGFYGPRALVVDAQGNVYVMDTGNKRVVIFDPQGKPLGQFGKAGMEPGQFDEPVGIALDSDGKIYIDDTWNQRVQVMSPDKSGNYLPLTSWEIAGWYGNSVDNKPYIAVDQMGHVFVTDPLGYRVLEFTTQGQFIRFWGDSGTGPDGFGQFINGIAVDSKGGVWVCDAFNNRIMHFTLPPE